MKFIFLPFFLILAFKSYALNSKVFSKQVQNLIKKQGLKPSHFGLVVSSKNKPSQVIYSLNADQLFIPASLTKMVTLSAFYNYFSPHHKFTTHFVSSASIGGSRLKGSLVLKGGGDPTFTSEALWNLVNVFFSLGIKTIEGDLLIDNSLFKTPFFLSRSDKSYEALTSATSFNWNSTTFRVRPSQIGKKAFIISDPSTSYIQIINKVKTVGPSKRTKVLIQRTHQSRHKEIFQLKGVISTDKKELIKYRNIQRPVYWLGYNTKNFLKQRGITVLGKVQKGTCEGNCSILAKWESKPFFWQAYQLMKHSSNFISRMLTIQLSLLKGHKKGDIHKGMSYIRDYIKSIGIKNYRFKDPSGLSRKNRFRPLDIHKILVTDLKSYYKYEIFASYPLAGGVGTLKDRYLDEMGLYPMRAKTGALSGVLGLSGFANSKEKYLFTFLYNGPYAKVNEARIILDEISKLLF